MSNIRFTPISGAFDESPLCYSLELDQARLLLDCGWTWSLKTNDLEPLRKLIKSIDAVLLSHVDIKHIGALPFLVKHGLNCPIYATLPVAQMGRLCLLDAVESISMERELEGLTREDVEIAFERIVQLKYFESVVMGGNCQGIVITPHSAGHTIGGAVWRIKKDTDEIVYAVSYNHKKERHLNGTVLESLYRPSLLICDTLNAQNIQTTRKQRDAELLTSIMDTFRKDGSVLLPVDSSARVLELAHLLDQLWAYHQLAYPLVLVTTQSQQTIEYAKGMLEWMGDAAIKQFATTRESPFDFKFVKICSSFSELSRFPSPKAVLASVPSLDYGLSKAVLMHFSMDPRNLLILTERMSPGSLSREIFNHLQTKTKINTELEIHQRIPLEGEELLEFEKTRQEERERQEVEEMLMERKRKILEGEEESDDEMEELNQQLLFYGDHFDYFNKGSKLMELRFFANDVRSVVFPHHEKRVKVDDYGEVINPDDYVDKKVEQAQQMNAQISEMISKNEEQMQLQQGRAGKENGKKELMPTKCVSYKIQFTLDCHAKFIDFEGLSDGKSIKTIIQNMAPKKVIFIHGSEEDTMHMANFARESEEFTDEIYFPRIGEVVNVSATTSIFQVKLTDGLLSHLKFTQLGDYEVAFIQGKIAYSTREKSLLGPTQTHESEETNSGDEMEIDNENEALLGIPQLELMPSSDRWKGHETRIIGDAKLTELKKLCSGAGLVSDFDRGSLVIGTGREIRVQKSEEGGLTLEGPLTKDYFRIRRLVYSLHALI